MVEQRQVHDYMVSTILATIKEGDSVRCNHRHTSIIVGFIDDEDTKLVLYKDWNKYAGCYNYHVAKASVFAFNVSLYMSLYTGKFGCGKARTQKGIDDYYKKQKKQLISNNTKYND